MKKNNTKRGASVNGSARKRQRRVTAQRNRARQFLRFILTGVAAGTVLAISLMTYQWFDRTSVRPVDAVSLSGSFSQLSREQIAQIIAPLLDNGELKVSLSELKGALEGNAWVDRASVNWRWPGRLNVSVIEQIPIARWGDTGFLNSRGEVVMLEDQSAIGALPLLSGLQGKEKLVMHNYQQLSQLFRSSELHIASLTSDDLMNLKIVLNSGAEIIVGRDQVMEKVQRFIVVYEQGLNQRFNEVATVDLRYGNGIAVAWNKANDKTVDNESLQLAHLSERRGG